MAPRDSRAPSTARLAIETPVWIDARFPAERKAAVEQALLRWNIALGGWYRFFIATDDLDRPRDWLNLGERPFIGWGATITYNAASPPGTPTNYLAQVRGDSDVQFYADHFHKGEPFEAVALHEFGHVLGLQDGEHGARLMISAWSPGQDCIDEGTIARLSRRHPSWRPDMHAECE